METVTRLAEVQWRLAMDANDVLDIGKRQGCTFLVHPYMGMIQEPKVGIGWVYVPYGSDDTVIPEEGKRRLRFLRDEGVRAYQVIIGHEIEVAEGVVDTEGRESQGLRLSPWMAAGIVAGVALSAVVIGAVLAPVAVPAATVATVAAPSVSTLGAVGLLSGAVLMDPSLVIVLEGTGQWVQVFSWV